MACVPAQVSVIGFDDIALAAYTIPALSSVKIR
jgi:LacI family asc operon transcriptional repressor